MEDHPIPTEDHVALKSADSSLTEAQFAIICLAFRAFNSAEECHLHTVEAAGSIPATPTKKVSNHGQLALQR